MGKITEQTESIKEVMNDIKRGIYNIPRFQREFVWPPKKIIGLINSIEFNFPFGVLLLAESKDSSLSGRNQIIDLVSRNDYKNNGKVVVDGQQRLTSITIVYFASLISTFMMRGELKRELKSTLSKVYNSICFYDSKFYSTSELQDKIKDEQNISDNLAKAKSKEFLVSIPEINLKVQNQLNNKKVYTHTLNGWTDSEIISIFTALNQKVTPLTHVDLMNGAMFNVSNNNFDLIGFINKSNNIWMRWGKIKPALFVQLIKLYSDIKIGANIRDINYKSDILVKWAGDVESVEEFLENKFKFRDLVGKTMSLMERKYNFFSLKHLPKDVYFIVIFAILCRYSDSEKTIETNLDKAISHITKRLVRGDYASSPNAKAQDDIKYLFNYFDKQLNDEEKFEYGDWEQALVIKLNNLKYRNKGDAIFKIMLSILSTNQPRNLFSNELVNVSPSSVTDVEFDIHHFIPLKSEFSSDYHFGDILNEVGNLALLSKKENREKIRSKNPFNYLKDSKKTLGDEMFKRSIESHLFDYELIEELMKLNGSESSVHVHALIRKLFNDRKKTILHKIMNKYIITK